MPDYREGTAELLGAFDRLPPTVKQAHVADLLGCGRPATDFADPYTQKYPFHSGEATLASLIRLESEPSAIKRAALQGKLMRKAALFGVDLPEQVKQAHAPEPAAVNDPLPVNAAEARAATAQAVEYSDRFTLGELSKLASRVISHFPDAVEPALLGRLEKWAGVGAFDRQAVAGALAKRAEVHLLAGRPEEAEVMAELGVAVLDGMPSEKIAEAAVLVDESDRDTGVYGLAGILPARDFCGHPLSAIEAAVESLVETKTGTVFSKAALADADTVKLAALFGDDYYRSLCDDGLFFSAERAAEAVSNADGVEASLWARVVQPVA